jgi:hypothetical protein
MYTITLAALVATLLPGVCAADCGSIMECCRRAPATDAVVGPASCCSGERPVVSGPTAPPADLRVKPARETAFPWSHAVDATASTAVAVGIAGGPAPSGDRHAQDVPIFLLNAAILC